MKIKSKVLLTLACAVLLIAASVMGTMAWLTASQTVTNTFTVGNVTITMDETSVNGGDRVTANQYHLVPGETYTKDPIIHVGANSDSCYLFVKVENGLSAIEANTDGRPTISSQMTSKGWKQLSGVDNVWYYAGSDNTLKAVNKSENITVFEHVYLADNAEVSAYAEATIVVTAYAIQSSNVSSTPATAWAAGGWTST